MSTDKIDIQIHTESNSNNSLYFRSETRSPDEIFNNGMSARNLEDILEYNKETWWYSAVKGKLFKNNLGYNLSATDADTHQCVSLTTKFESSAVFPLNSTHNFPTSLKEGETYVYFISLPKALKVDYETKERDIYVMSSLPGDVEKYKNSYIFIKGSTNIWHITRSGVLKRAIPSSYDPIFYMKELDDLYKKTEADLYNYDEGISLQSQEIAVDEFWVFLVRTSDAYGKQGLEIESSNLPVEKQVIDLHSLQTAQTGNITKNLIKQGLFRKYAHLSSENIGWPLYAYEAVALTVPKENIIGAVLVSRTSAKIKEFEPLVTGATPNKSITRRFKIEGEFIVNPNFTGDEVIKERAIKIVNDFKAKEGCELVRMSTDPTLQNISQINRNQYIITEEGLWYFDCAEYNLEKLDLGEKTPSSLLEELKLDSNVSRTATKEELEQITSYTGHKADEGIETPTVYYGLGGKTF
ncbi:hypothetical protein [Legionella saoudiensis]|uniref:hypothetical protein n=1 Tax=Legionella saoudiensis TaxID=1750561 RepID=UPI0007307DFC|nr:hypothetical protein [Legionella saoudiensis]